MPAVETPSAAPESATQAEVPTTRPGSTKKLTSKTKGGKAKSKGKAKAGGKKANKAKGERGPSKTQIEVLKALNRNADGLTRHELAEKLETFVGGKIMGHVDPKKQRKTSLVGRGLASMHAGDPRKLKDGSFSETEGASIYKITAAGRKLLEGLK